MSKFKFSRQSLAKLGGLHPDLVKVIHRALELTDVDFGITEGLRSKNKQVALVAEGKSQTLNSRHLTGHAIDVVAYVNGKVSWDFGLYERIANAFLKAGAEFDIPIVWGGLWTTLKDGCHFELHRGKYP